MCFCFERVASAVYFSFPCRFGLDIESFVTTYGIFVTCINFICRGYTLDSIRIYMMDTNEDMMVGSRFYIKFAINGNLHGRCSSE